MMATQMQTPAWAYTGEATASCYHLARALTSEIAAGLRTSAAFALTLARNKHVDDA